MSSILVITNNSGGLYLFRRQLLKQLIAQGDRITVLSPFTSRVEELREMGIEMHDIQMDRRGMNPIRDLKLFFRYYRQIRKSKPDLVVTYTIKPNIYANLAARMCGTEYAANVTGLGTAFENGGLIQSLSTVLYRLALKKAKAVFFENESNKAFFVARRIVPEDKCKVLQGAGVDLEHFGYQEYPRDNGEINFIFIGRIMKEKGVDELFDAMSRLRQEGLGCRLTVIGSFEEKYQSTVEKYTREGWLHFEGYSYDVRQNILTAHCGVLPSYHEGMSNTNLECAASGRPLITSDIPGCKEAVIDGRTGFLCSPKDTESLYLAMKKMIGLLPEEREQMGKEGRKHMEECFDKRKVVQETIRYIMQ